MDDEEEDMSRPISQCWGTPFRDVKCEDRATQIAAAVSTPSGHNNNSIGAMPCSLHRQPRIPFHGNAGLRSHFPAQFEPMEDRGEGPVGEEAAAAAVAAVEVAEEQERRGEDRDGVAERREERAGVSVEAQIGRKLREIGDKFNQDHVDLFMRQQRQNLPVWMRLTIALFGFLFPRQQPLAPQLRGEQQR